MPINSVMAVNVKTNMASIAVVLVDINEKVAAVQQRIATLEKLITSDDNESCRILQEELNVERTKLQQIKLGGIDSLLPLAKGLPTLTKIEPRLDTFLQDMKTVKLNDTVCRLPHSQWWNNKKNGQEIFVRKCFHRIFEKIEEKVQSNAPVLVTGSPGIGKSVFGHWMVAKFLQRGNCKIIYGCNVNNKEVYYHIEPHAEHISVGGPESIEEELDRPEVILILDAIPPPTFQSSEAWIILITSPNRDIWKRAEKESELRRLYMPIWSLDDISRCARFLQRFQGISREVYVSHYEKWGGMIRYVLQKAKLESEEHGYEGLISESDENDVVRSILEARSKPGVSDRLALLHVTDNNFSRVEVRLTAYTQKLIFDRMLSNDIFAQERLINTGVRSGATARIVGYHFEELMHRKIIKGMTTRCRLLDPPLPDDVDNEADYVATIPGREKHIFDTVRDIPGNVYGVPLAHNFPVIDGLYLPHFFFQSTVADRHPINGPQLKKLLDAVKTRAKKNRDEVCSNISITSRTSNLAASLGDINFVWVVPRNRFSTFQAQKFQTFDKKPYQDQHKFSGFKQWVMQLQSDVSAD